MSKPEPPEFQVERDYDARCAHARSMYHMAVQRAETELDLALGLAEEIRQGELADLRHGQHQAVMFTPSRVATQGDPNGSLPTIDDVIAVTRMADLP